MKLALVTLLTFILVECQQKFYSLNPRFYNALQFNAQSQIDESLPQLMVYQQPSWRHNLQDADNLNNEQAAIKSGNSLARLYLNNNYNNPGVYTPPTSGSGTYSPNPMQVYYNSPAGPFWLKSRVYTAYVTTTVISLSYCIPSTQFSPGANAKPCGRRRREILELLDVAFEDAQMSSIHAAPVNKVETTALATETKDVEFSELDSAIISSSKDEVAEVDPSKDNAARNKRLFNIFAVPMTVTSYIFVTSTVPKTITLHTIQSCAGASSASCLLCMPPGYGLCY